MSWDNVLIVVAVIVGGWQLINLGVTLLTLYTKQLVQADRGIAWYFIFVSFVAFVAIMALGFRVAELNGYIGAKNAVAEEVLEAGGD